MNLATAIAVAAASINLATAVLAWSVSRAPGWRAARVFAFIAATAGLYNLSGVVFSVGGLPTGAYLLAGRFAYLCVTVHCAAWVVFAYRDQGSSQPGVPRWVAVLVASSSAVAVGFAVTGLHLQQAVATIEVAWAGVAYELPLTTSLGDVYGLLALALLGVALARLVNRARAGEPDLWPHVIAFVVFIGCAVVELLVANRAISFLSLADVGFVVVVVPLTVRLVRRVVADARRLEALSGRLSDEVRQRTEERDRAEEALVEAERLAALGRLAAGVGHEINNPLTYMQLALDELETEIGHRGAVDASGRALASVREGAWRIQKVVEGLRSYSRNQEGHEPVDLHEVARAALRVAGPRLRHAARLDSDLAPVPKVIGDEPRLVQALVNLLANAGQAVAERGSEGRIAVRTGTDPEGWAILSVTDNGAGIAPDHLARLSEPYFTTRGRSGGLGLGLFVTRGIVDAHGGRLDIQSQDGRGTTATIVLPPPSGPVGIETARAPRLSGASPAGPVPIQVAADSPGSAPEAPQTAPARSVVAADEAAEKPGCARVAVAAAASSEVVGAAIEVSSPAPVLVEVSCKPPESPGPGGGPSARTVSQDLATPADGGRLLLVDDEPMVREFLARALGRRWQVTAVHDGHSALGVLQAGGFDAIVCDLMMPGISGIELGQRIEAAWPTLWPRVVFLTGGAITEDAERFLARPDVRHLVKPVQVGALEAVLETVVAASTDRRPGQ